MSVTDKPPRSATTIACLPRHGSTIINEAAEPAGDHLVHGGHVVLALDLADDESSILALPGETVFEDHHRADYFGALQVGDVIALDSEWSARQLERLLNLFQCPIPGRKITSTSGLVLYQDLLGVTGDCFHQCPLVATLGHPDRDMRAAALLEHPGQRLGRGRYNRHQDLPWHGISVACGGIGLGVQLQQELFDQLLSAAIIEPVGNPATLASDTSAAYVEDLDGDLQRVLGNGDHICIGAVSENHGVSLHGSLQSTDVIPQPSRSLELQRIAGRPHFPFQLLDHRPRLARHELAEVLDNRAMLVGAHPPNARCGALADVAKETGPAKLLVVLEDSGPAGPHRKYS